MRSLWLWLLGLVFGITLFLTDKPAMAADLCETPQSAAASLLDNLQTDNWQPDLAAKCLDVPPEREAERTRLAIKLKKVLDARGLYVPTADLPQNADYSDDLGRHRLEPLVNFPDVVLDRTADGWMYSRATVARIDPLYASTFSSFSQAFQDALPDFFMRHFLGIELWQVLYFLLLLAVSLAAGRSAQVLLANQVLRITRRLRVATTTELIQRTRGPLTWVTTGAVFMWGIPDLQLSVRQSQVLLLFARLVLAFAIVVVAVRVVDIVADIWAEKAKKTDSKFDDQVVPLLRRIAKVVISAVAILVVIENMGVDVAGLIAGLGIGGLAFALAAKDTLENVFGSIVIFLDRPFQVGDWVVIDGSTEGVVEEVGFRTTRIRTFYNSLLSVPNGKVAMAHVDNMGLRKVRRLKMDLGLTYDTPRAKVEAFVQQVRDFMKADPVVWDGTLEIHFNSFGDSSLNVMIYAFLDVPDWSQELQNRHRIMLEWMRISEDLGISFAFPSQSLYVETLPPGLATPSA
ncbi:MAG: mechanosensitive ion channel family protein [Oligoflexia bacterium]|nr:mechanosensitive ion channel family protein [Oligoflexia bacterium]